MSLPSVKNAAAASWFRRLDRDSAPHLFQCFCDLARRSRDTALATLLASWWGVDLGAKCHFYGLPIIRRLPGSAIRIGTNSQFRSAVWSNLAGVNRPCVLATLLPGAVLEIGSDCGFSGTAIGCASRISIGTRVMCGANVSITDTDWHPIDWRERAAHKAAAGAPVTIGDDVWLGMNVTVLKGVEIGSRTVVGAGSVVARSLPAGVVAAGYPAVVIRRLHSDEDPKTVVETIGVGGSK